MANVRFKIQGLGTWAAPTGASRMCSSQTGSRRCEIHPMCKVTPVILHGVVSPGNLEIHPETGARFTKCETRFEKSTVA